jgi:hypothetical protein
MRNETTTRNPKEATMATKGTFGSQAIADRIMDEIERQTGRLDARDDAPRQNKSTGAWMIDARSWDLFTDRCCVEDDDHPDFTGCDKVVAAAKKATEGTGWIVSSVWAQEKKWFTVEFNIDPEASICFNADGSITIEK